MYLENVKALVSVMRLRITEAKGRNLAVEAHTERQQ